MYIVMFSFIQLEPISISARKFDQCSATLLVVHLFDQVGPWPGKGPPLISLHEILGGFWELVVLTLCGMICDPWHIVEFVSFVLEVPSYSSKLFLRVIGFR